MSTTYSANVGIGFVFTRDEFLAPFKKHQEEKAHFEDRFDPKTGVKQLPEKVIDSEAGEYVFFDAENFGADNEVDLHELCERIGDFLGALVHPFGGYYDGGDFIAVELSVEGMGDEDSCGNFDVGRSVSLEEIVKVKPRFAGLATKLKKLGIHQGRLDEPLVPRVFIDWDVG